MTQPDRSTDSTRVRAPSTAATMVPWLIGLSLLTLLFTLPHSVEDFVYGVPQRFGLSVMVAGILLSLAIIAQIVGLLLISKCRMSGFVLTLGIGLVWLVGAITDHLHDLLFTWPYREGVISKVMEVAIILSMAALAAISAVGIVNVRKSRT